MEIHYTSIAIHAHVNRNGFGRSGAPEASRPTKPKQRRSSKYNVLYATLLRLSPVGINHQLSFPVSPEMADQAYHHSLTNHTPDNYNKHADFVYSAKNTAPIFELLEAKPGERIIDLGCGTGELTEIIREAVGDAGEVWGVDSSESMVSEQKPSYLNLPRS